MITKIKFHEMHVYDISNNQHIEYIVLSYCFTTSFKMAKLENNF